jgi:hypothetical protein
MCISLWLRSVTSGWYPMTLVRKVLGPCVPDKALNGDTQISKQNQVLLKVERKQKFERKHGKGKAVGTVRWLGSPSPLSSEHCRCMGGGLGGLWMVFSGWTRMGLQTNRSHPTSGYGFSRCWCWHIIEWIAQKHLETFCDLRGLFWSLWKLLSVFLSETLKKPPFSILFAHPHCFIGWVQEGLLLSLLLPASDLHSNFVSSCLWPRIITKYLRVFASSFVQGRVWAGTPFKTHDKSALSFHSTTFQSGKMESLFQTLSCHNY